MSNKCRRLQNYLKSKGSELIMRNAGYIVGIALMALGGLLQIIGIVAKAAERSENERIIQYQNKIVKEGDVVVIDGIAYKLSAKEIE